MLKAAFSESVEAGPALTGVDLCTGTNGDGRSFVYKLYNAQGGLIKEITYSAAHTEATTALKAVAEALKAASSNDAAVAQAGMQALAPALKALSAFMPAP